MGKFAVFGNPIKHSKSPQIHRQFAEQFSTQIDYQALLAPLDEFEAFTQDFFINQAGQGANVTLPFKERAFELVDELTERAQLAGAVNTIKKLDDGNTVEMHFNKSCKTQYYTVYHVRVLRLKKDPITKLNPMLFTSLLHRSN